jgi:GT2 family glycosyltransferase
MKVSIVIPNWNGAEKLRKNLPEVLKVKGVDEVIVSDDASTDDSVQILKKEFPEIKLIIRQKNGGFSSNVNTGFKNASGDFIFLLNSDAVPEPDCVQNALPHFKDEKVFSVGCNVGGTWTWAKWENGFFWHHQAKGTPKAAHQTLWASGGSSIFRKSIWDQLNGLDELFDPFYEEDVDIGYRATKRGYINLWEPRSKVEHYKQKGVIEENFSKSKVAKTAQRNQLFLIWKNITDEDLIAEHKSALAKMLLTKPKYWEIFLKAFIHFNKVAKMREVEKKESTLTDNEVFKKFSGLI